jgi:ubiquinone biosynthesis protein UbiJ
VTTDATINADVDIKLKSNVFLKLIQGEDLTELLRQDKIMIHGDVKTAQLLVDLLQQVEFDFEEALSKFTGDIVAHQVGKIAKKFKSSDNSLASIKDKITNFLITPKRFH